jgi:molybdopterin-guanine dinucleotide biosynthesis protein A
VSVRLQDVAGLLIAGGRSLRFGQEKAVSPFRGAPMMDASARALAGLGALAVSARAGSGAEAHAHALSLPVLHDDPQLASGPLTGVLAGLRWAQSNGFGFLATAPCDAPLLPHDLVSRLAQAMGEANAAYAVTAQGEHPLCALWRVDLADAIAACLNAGEHPAVRAMLTASGAVPVQFADANAFANANTQVELAVLEQRS